MINLKEIYPNLLKDDWEYIFLKRPDLKKVKYHSLDSVIVEFLKQYEVYVKPVTSGTRNRGESAMAGAITGIAGADVGGDAFLISGQKKQTAVQEWTHWKQWALDHKDFPAFKEKLKANNDKIEELLSSQKVRDEINNLIKERKEQTYKTFFTLIAVLAILVGGLGTFRSFIEPSNQYPSIEERK